MIRHIVMWKVKDGALGNTKEQNIALMKQQLELLEDKVGKNNGLLEVEVGVGFNPRGYDISLICTLMSLNALKIYDVHPEHLKVKEFVSQVASERVVVDYEI